MSQGPVARRDRPGMNWMRRAPASHEALREAAVRAPGSPLPPAFRSAVEARFGHDFGRVRVHADEGAHNAAEALGARAFTLGTDIFLARAASVGTRPDPGLMAHELAHVVQQRDAHAIGVPEPSASLEAGADEAAMRFHAGQRVRVLGTSEMTVAKQTQGQAAPSGASILTALQRNDGTALFTAIDETAGKTGAKALVRDLSFRESLRALAQGAFLFTILRRLWFPAGTTPAAVAAFEDALNARDAARAIDVLTRFPDLRDPEKVPGVYEVVEHVFKGSREYAQLMELLSFDVAPVLATAQQSRHFRTLLSLAQHFSRESGGTGPLVGKGGEPGHTFTGRATGIVIQPDVPSSQAALTKVTHEVSNLALSDQFEKVYDRRNSGGFSTARQFAEAMIGVEEESVVERHEVAIDLGLPGDDPVVDGLVRQRGSGAITQAALDAAVTQRIIQVYQGPGGVSALETYERQFRDWQRLMGNPPKRSP